MKKLLLLLLFSHVLLAQPTYHFDLLKDINNGTNDAKIKFVINVGNTAVIFHADKDINTGETILRLWKSNGTTMENFASSDIFHENALYYKPTVIDDYIFFYSERNMVNNGNGLHVVKLNSPVIKRIDGITENPRILKFNAKIYIANGSQQENGRLYYYNEITNQTTEIQGASQNFHNPLNLTIANNSLFFTAATGGFPIAFRYQLWKSDGTKPGTQVVKEIGPEGRMLGHMGKAGNRVIFDAFENNTSSLYVSDGTAIGTYPFKSLESFASYPYSSTTVIAINSFGDKALIHLYNNTNYELWITDGTDANTKLMATYDSIGLLENNEIATKDGFLFFTSMSGELFKANDTSITVLKNTGIPNLNRNDFKMIPNQVDNKIYFSLGEIFYKTDGTSAGTELISDQLASDFEIWRNNPYALTSNKILAYTLPKNHTNFGTEIYEIRSDTTKILKDLDSTTKSASIKFLLNAKGKSYFLAQDATSTEQKVYETDGTPEGTRGAPIEDIVYGQRFFDLNGNLFALRENQMQKINFSSRNYENIKTFTQYIILVDPVQIGNKFYFIMQDNHYGLQYLWVSDGTTEGTNSIRQFESGEIVRRAEVYNQVLYVFTSTGATTRIWKFSNPASTPTLVKTIDSYGIGRTYASFRNKLAFILGTPYGSELWTTDGTSDGTTQLNSFPYSLNVNPEYMYFTNSHYYYSSDAYNNNNIKVWKSDGTPDGTIQVANITDGSNNVTEFCLCNNDVFFRLGSASNTHKTYMYKNAITANTSTFLATVGVGVIPHTTNNQTLHCVNKQLYFPSAGNGIEDFRRFLYTSNGTPEGTYSILSLENRYNFNTSFKAGELYPLNDHELLVLTNDKLYDVEWFTFRRCDNPTNLSGTTADSKIQSSSTFLESTEKLDGDSRVYYFAPKSITLKPGFSVDNTNVFKAEIKNRPCTLRQ